MILYHKKWHNPNYFGIFPKLGGTINLWFSSIIGSFSHLQHPATKPTNEQSANNIAIFFMTFFLLYIWGHNAPDL